MNRSFIRMSFLSLILLFLSCALIGCSTVRKTAFFDYGSYFDKGYKCLMAGKIREAKANFSFVCLDQTNNAQAYYFLGLCYEREGNNEMAVLAYKAALGINPSMGDPYVRLGVIAFKAHDYRNAQLLLLRAQEICPNNAVACYYLGQIFYGRGYIKLATCYFEGCLQIDPYMRPAYLWLADCYEKLGNNEQLKKMKELAGSKTFARQIRAGK